MSNLMNKILLIYDGDCQLCVQAIGKLTDFGLLNGIRTVSWQDTDLHDEEMVERIKTEFLLIDNQQIDGGFQAIAKLFGKRFPGLGTLLMLPGVLQAGQALYKTVSMNRRILAPAGRIACSCDPPFHFGYRMTLWILLLGIAFAGSAIFGASLITPHPDRSFAETAWQLTLSAGSGWALNFLVFIPLLGKRYWTLVQQCLVVMAIGIFWLMPVALMNWLGSLSGIPAAVLLQLTMLGVAANSLIMFLSIRRRSARLSLPKWLPWLWLLLLELAGIPLFIHFRLFN